VNALEREPGNGSDLSLFSRKSISRKESIIPVPSSSIGISITKTSQQAFSLAGAYISCYNDIPNCAIAVNIAFRLYNARRKAHYETSFAD
jgi:hypothetical protein